VHWLCSKAQFERWLEEQDSIHNEAQWIPAYFHSKAETWTVLITVAEQGILKGHAAYYASWTCAPAQACAHFKDLSRSALSLQLFSQNKKQ
jgi:hypothetical protein